MRAKPVIQDLIKHHQKDLKCKPLIREILAREDLPNQIELEELEQYISDHSKWGDNFIVRRHRTLDLGSLFKSISPFELMIWFRDKGYRVFEENNKLIFRKDLS